MRVTVGLMLVAGWCSIAGSLPAQTQDRPLQRFSNLLTKGRFDPIKTDAFPAAADVPRPSPPGSFETRGVVYVEEMRPATPPKLVAAPRAPLTLPQPTPPAVRPQPLPTTANTPRPPAIAQDEALVQRLTKQINQTCPQVRNVKLTFKSAKEVTVELEVRSMEEANAQADRIFAIRDLDPYRIQLKFHVPQS